MVFLFLPTIFSSSLLSFPPSLPSFPFLLFPRICFVSSYMCSTLLLLQNTWVPLGKSNKTVIISLQGSRKPGSEKALCVLPPPLQRQAGFPTCCCPSERKRTKMIWGFLYKIDFYNHWCLDLGRNLKLPVLSTSSLSWGIFKSGNFQWFPVFFFLVYRGQIRFKISSVSFNPRLQEPGTTSYSFVHMAARGSLNMW